MNILVFINKKPIFSIYLIILPFINQTKNVKIGVIILDSPLRKSRITYEIEQVLSLNCFFVLLTITIYYLQLTEDGTLVNEDNVDPLLEF